MTSSPSSAARGPIVDPRDRDVPVEASARPASIHPCVAPRWSAFMYTMPSNPTRHRVALWRELHKLDAVNLLHATWAIPHSEAGEPDLSRLHELVAAAGGTSSSAEVDGKGSLDVDLGRRLVRGCEQLWDGFFHALDRFQSSEDDDEVMIGVAHEALAELRREFAELSGRDLVMSGAFHRASRGLDRCTFAVLAAVPEPALTSDERTTRHTTELAGPGVALADGTVRYVARIQPASSIAWDRALAEFESTVYRSDPSRPEIHHGIVVLEGDPTDRDVRRESVHGRLRRFEQSLL